MTGEEDGLTPAQLAACKRFGVIAGGILGILVGLLLIALAAAIVAGLMWAVGLLGACPS